MLIRFGGRLEKEEQAILRFYYFDDKCELLYDHRTASQLIKEEMSFEFPSKSVYLSIRNMVNIFNNILRWSTFPPTQVIHGRGEQWPGQYLPEVELEKSFSRTCLRGPEPGDKI